MDHYIQASRQSHEVETIIPMLSLRKQAWRVVKYVLGATHLGRKDGGGFPWAVYSRGHDGLYPGPLVLGQVLEMMKRVQVRSQAD